VPTLGLRLP